MLDTTADERVNKAVNLAPRRVSHLLSTLHLRILAFQNPSQSEMLESWQILQELKN
jgi:hypothetical protein